MGDRTPGFLHARNCPVSITMGHDKQSGPRGYSLFFSVLKIRNL